MARRSGHSGASGSARRGRQGLGEPADLAPAAVPASITPTEEQLNTPPPLSPEQAAQAAGDRAPAPDAPAEATGPDVTTRQAPLLFEVAWEVCWQLGGIYTVLRTKAPAMMSRWGERYCLIGPYNPATAAVEFEERPTEGHIREALDRLRADGVPCHYGHWLVPGRPHVILLDYRARYPQLDVDKYLMWKDHGIDVPPSDGEVNETIAFGFTVTQFFRHLTDVVTDRPVLAQFHEWMGGVAVPRLAHLRVPVATVFTTHATLLGRYLAGGNPDFYHHLPFLNADHEAGKYNIYPKFAIERAAAHAATVFTTVSEVTAFEAEKLLGRQPDVILPNGLNIQRFAALHEFQNLHREAKERIHEFVMGHFFPSYAFDLDRTLYVLTSGRYEYRNKGMDLYIESLHRLNERLKRVSDPPTIVAFVVTRAATRNINIDVLKNQSMFDDLRHTCLSVQQQIGQKLFAAAVGGRMPIPQDLLDDDSHVRLKRAIHAWRSGRQPTIVTHDLADDANDAVLKHLRYRQLFNAETDPVKVIYHPEFVSATSPLLNMDYDQFVRGCHVGVFPSYYEPWGYTPAECIALGVPAVTSDLSGFGAYVQRHVPDHDANGLVVVNRRTRRFDESANEVADYLFAYAQLDRRQRIDLRNRAERLSELFDWSVLIRHYDEAHDLALARKGAGRVGTIDVRMV